MANRTWDPRQRRMPFDDWPVEDRRAWHEATREGGILEDQGRAAHWRPSTRRTVMGAYGHYLKFLARHGWLDSDVAPEKRMTLDWIRTYLDELSELVAPVTLAGRLTNLREALRVMAPAVEFPYLKRG